MAVDFSAAGAGSGADPAPSIWDIRGRLEENFRRVEAVLAELERSEDPKLRLAAAAELRQHIALAEKTLATAESVEAHRAFEETILTVLAEASAALRKKALGRLNARAAEMAGRPGI